MKVIINENNVIGILLKLWKKNPYLDPTQLKMFGLSPNNVSVVKMFREFLGDEEIEKRLLSLHNKFKLRTDIHINNCGNYDFEFSILDWYWSDDDILEFNCEVGAEEGTVTIGDEERSLDDAIHNDDYGWEVKDEVTDCVSDFIEKSFNINYLTGLNPIINIRYT